MSLCGEGRARLGRRGGGRAVLEWRAAGSGKLRRPLFFSNPLLYCSLIENSAGELSPCKRASCALRHSLIIYTLRPCFKNFVFSSYSKNKFNSKSNCVKTDAYD